MLLPTFEQLVAALDPLIIEGRFAGSLIILDGTTIHDEDAEGVVDPIDPVYLDDGFSVAPSIYGGFSHEGLDEIIAEWIASGDQDKAKVARGTAQYYFVFRAGNEVLNQEQRWQRSVNFFMGRFIAAFGGQKFGACYVWNNTKFLHKDGGEPIQYEMWLNSAQWASEQYKEISFDEFQGEKMANHQVYYAGKAEHPDNPKYQEYLDAFLEEKVATMQRLIAGARRKRLDAADPSAIRPGAGPHRS